MIGSNKCRACFFKEISLRGGATTFLNMPRLWCWLRDKHVSKSDSCEGWTKPDTEGNPREVAEYYKKSKMIREYMRRKKEARRITS